MTTKFALVGCSIALWWVSASAQAVSEKPVIVGNPALVLESQATSGSVAVDLRNDTDKLMSLQLAVSPAQDAGQGATLTIKGRSADAASFDLPVKQRDAQRISIEVSGADADFDIDLLNGVDRIGKIPVTHKPFSVHLTDPKAIVHLNDGKSSDISVTNDDAGMHAVRWRLRVDGRDVCDGQATLAPKSATALTCAPKFGWGFWSSVSTWFRPLLSPDATVIFESSAAAPQQPPLRVLSLAVSSEYFSGPFQQGLNYLVLFVVLIAGGVVSLLLSQIIPNRLSRLTLREQFEQLDRVLSGLGAQIDSSLQVLLRVERSRLGDLLGSRGTYSPEFALIATQCSEGLDRLKRRAALVQQLETVLRQLRQAETTIRISWTQSQRAHANASRAQEILRNAMPSEEEFLAAAKAIADASSSIGSDAEADSALQQTVKARVDALKKELPQLTVDPEFARVSNQVPVLVNMIEHADDINDVAALDRAVTKLTLVKTYLRHRSGVTVADNKQRMDEAEKRFVGLLQNSNVTSIVEAASLLQQIRDDVYTQDISNALRAKQARVVVDPVVVYERIPLQFSVKFNDPRLDRAAAARTECQCQWEFGDGLTESSWEVMHYYQLKKQDPVFTARATFTERGKPIAELKAEDVQKAAGSAVTVDQGKAVALETAITVKPSRDRRLWFGERTVVEAFKLAAALMIAVFGLVAGAREEIVKLDILSGIVAVFLIGFGADTIKSLLSSSKT